MAWFADENLQSVFEIIAEYAGCELTEAEWDAIRLGVTETHTERGMWFDYFFEGEMKVSFRLGYDEPGTGVIFLEYSAPNHIGAKLDVVLDLAKYRTISCLHDWRKYERPGTWVTLQSGYMGDTLRRCFLPRLPSIMSSLS